MALARAMRRLVTEPGLLTRLRPRPGEIVLRSLDDQLDGLELRYRELLAAQQARPTADAASPIRRVLIVSGIVGAPLRYRGYLPQEALGSVGVHADLLIKGQHAEFRATLCRCGLSKNKPYCDNSHVGAFVATGEPPAQPNTLAIVELIGPVEITPFPNGPLGVKGAIEISSGTGRAVNRVTQTTLCRCGHSANKPYCDSTHRKIGFQAP